MQIPCSVRLETFDRVSGNLIQSDSLSHSMISLDFPENKSSGLRLNHDSVHSFDSWSYHFPILSFMIHDQLYEYSMHPKTCTVFSKFVEEGKITIRLEEKNKKINVLCSGGDSKLMKIFCEEYERFVLGGKENTGIKKQQEERRKRTDQIGAVKIDENVKAIVNLARYKVPRVPFQSLENGALQKRVLQNNKSPLKVVGKKMFHSPAVSSPMISKRINVQASPNPLNLIAEKMSEEQTRIIEHCLKGGSCFFSGAAGTGKSFLLEKLIHVLKKKYKNDEVYVTAPTGIAAVRINGITLHSFSGFGAKMQSAAHDILYFAKSCMQNFQQWTRAKILIIDEISMVDARQFDLLNDFAQLIRNQQKLPFGGIQVIACGDFFQLPPIGKESERKFCFEAKAWNSIMKYSFELTRVYRQGQDSKFIEFLSEIRKGKCSKEAVQYLSTNCGTALQQTKNEPTTLLTHKEDVERINRQRLDNLPGKKVLLNAHDNSNNDLLLKQLQSNCPAKAQLELKIGARVALLKNLAVGEKLCNGSLGTVVSFQAPNNFPVVDFDGKSVLIEPSSWTIQLNGLSAKRVQIPLDLAWNFSIHRSQGMTLNYVEVALQKVFEYGQAYVALSRAKSLGGLRFSNSEFNPKSVRAHPKVISFYQKLESGAAQAAIPSQPIADQGVLKECFKDI